MSITTTAVITCDTCGDVTVFTDPLAVRNLRLSAATRGWRCTDAGDICKQCRVPQGVLALQEAV